MKPTCTDILNMAQDVFSCESVESRFSFNKSVRKVWADCSSPVSLLCALDSQCQMPVYLILSPQLDSGKL